ncbi:hypothetical protein [Streptomyces flavidovirens]|uniref:hypothetical protein n=1 Tax=Streptomyces flavidovirens TaxID=67298 RepID=UPI0012FED90A|nr:hypothetical protein [Streptomyces flavidovirens]
MATLLATTPALTGCGDSGGKETGLDIGGVHEAFERGDSDSVVGQVGTFSGYVKEAISPWAFTIGGDEFSGVEPLLIIEKDLPAVNEDELVHVTGTVQKFDLPKVQKELGVDFAETLYKKFQGEPCVRAREMTRDVEQ